MIGNSYQTITLRRSRVVVSLPFLIRKALRPCQWWWGRRLNKQKITHAKGTKASKRTLAWSETSGLGRSSISSARLHSYRPVLYVGQNCRACGLLHEHCCPRSTTDLETGPGLSLFGTSSPLRVRVHGVEWKQKRSGCMGRDMKPWKHGVIGSLPDSASPGQCSTCRLVSGSTCRSK